MKKKTMLLVSFLLIILSLTSCKIIGGNADTQSQDSAITTTEETQEETTDAASESAEDSALSDQQIQQAKDEMLEIINDLKE